MIGSVAQSGPIARSGRHRWRVSLSGPRSMGAVVEAKDLFGVALGLQKPWFVKQTELDRESHRLTLTLDFAVGARLPCPTCGEVCPTHDTVEGRWRHLNFFQYVTELVARVPRTKCGRDGVHVVAVPWARPGSGFTMLFKSC